MSPAVPFRGPMVSPTKRANPLSLFSASLKKAAATSRARAPPVPVPVSLPRGPPADSPFQFHTANPDGWPAYVETAYTRLTEAGLAGAFNQAVVAWTELERKLGFNEKVCA